MTLDGCGPRTEMDQDDVHEMLSNKRRRYVIDEIHGCERMSMGELAERVAARENDKPVENVRGGERKRVYISLYQCHLGRLDDVGAVEFDGDRKIVCDRDTEVLCYISDETERLTR